jgi:hypothetical protein
MLILKVYRGTRCNPKISEIPGHCASDSISGFGILASQGKRRLASTPFVKSLEYLETLRYQS